MDYAIVTTREATPSQAQYAIDGKVIYYRASAIGGCLRKLYFARMGFDGKAPTDNMQAIFSKGHELEPIILQRLIDEQGWQLREYQGTIEFQVYKNVYVTGHYDAEGMHPVWTNGEWIPVDAKSFAQSTMDSWMAGGIDAFPHYAWQQSAYAIGMGVDRFCLPLLNKDTNELHVVIEKKLPYTKADFLLRLSYIEDHVAKNEQPDCDNSYPCPFYYLHDAKATDSLDESQEKMAQSYANLSDKIKLLDIARKAISSKLLKDIPYTDDLRTFTSPSFEVTVVANPKRLNTQAIKELLKQAEVDIDEYYTPGEGVSIRIKAKK